MLGKNREKDRIKELEEEAERLRGELAEKEKTIEALTQKLDTVKAFAWQRKEEAEAALGTVRHAMSAVQEAVKQIEAAEPMPQDPHNDKEA